MSCTYEENLLQNTKHKQKKATFFYDAIFYYYYYFNNHTIKITMADDFKLHHSDRIAIARKHFEGKGYRAHSGLQFGCELVLYADLPSIVHSDFCVHIPAEDTRLNWMTIQTLVRSMPDLHKTLIIANVKECSKGDADAVTFDVTSSKKYFKVEEIALSSEHAPFRHKSVTKGVGGQLKKQKIS